MSILSRARAALKGDAARALSPNDIWLQGMDALSSSGTVTGQAVNATTAMQSSTVYACVRILSDSVSTLPLDTFQRVDGNRRPLRPRPAFLDFRVGPESKIDVLGQAMVSLLLDGNAFLASPRDAEGNILYLQALDPSMVTVEVVGGQHFYRLAHNQAMLDTSAMIHIRGMTRPGEIRGISPITACSETIGLGLAATEYGGTFFGNGGVPGMTVEVPGQLSPAGIKALKLAWRESHNGKNANGLAVLTEGAKFQKITLAPNDAQFLETRKFQVNDIARIFGVPVSLLQHSDGAELGQSIGDKNTHFVQHTLRPWVERMEEALSDALRSEGFNPNGFVKINLGGLLRGDHSTRFLTYTAAVRDGILTINEVRRLEDYGPVPWGDVPISVQVQGTTEETPTPASEEETP